jgi:hypothetical protein
MMMMIKETVHFKIYEDFKSLFSSELKYWNGNKKLLKPENKQRYSNCHDGLHHNLATN